jgi:hypothetical protein
LQHDARKSNAKVSIIPPGPPGLYAQWRAQSWTAHTLAERSERAPLSERLLQLIWQHQRLRRDDLQTTDGRTVKILHPGFWNHEAGPDFRDAVIQIGQSLASPGDVEVDLVPQGWRSHGHDQNPSYRNVVLHVVWEADPHGSASLPTLALKARLDAPLEELGLWLRNEPDYGLAGLLGRCSACLRSLPEVGLGELLRQAADVRLQTKAAQLQARAKEAGWQHALWEGLFGALGYKHNLWAMRRLSEMLPTILASGDQHAPSNLVLQARLLGVSGLLPSEANPARPATIAYLRSVWDIWWRERERFAELILPRSMWRLDGLRPANSPPRRLALAAHWLSEMDLPARLENWFASAEPEPKSPAKLVESLWQVLQTSEDSFWSRHWTFRSACLPHAQPLIGLQRVTDLAVNVILPWFWIRAVVGQNTSLQRRAEACYFAWPRAEDNAVLRLARRRLFGTARLAVSRTAAMQQGLLQIVRDFCDYSNALCENCQFPALVQGGGGGGDDGTAAGGVG